MKTQLLFLLISMTFLSACSSQINKDYVELDIPASLKDNPEALEYLQSDVKQLNKLFNSLDEFATELEEITILVHSIDTADAQQIEAIKPEVTQRAEKMTKSIAKLYFNAMWYLGKDLLEDESTTAGIIERLDTDEGIAFRKSMKHIKLKKSLIKERIKSFEKRMEALDLKKKGE